MEPIDINCLMLLSHEEFSKRVEKIRTQMEEGGMKALLISDNANTYYLTGRVFTGYIYIPHDGEVIFFVRRPVKLEGDGVVYIRKPEEMAQSIELNAPENIGLELEGGSIN